jgi:excisionase family DNA binding protein
MERLLSVPEAAERLGTTRRFPRRLIAEKRIRFVRLGRYVRIPEWQSRSSLKPGRCSQSLGPRCHDLPQASFGSIGRRESGNYQARYRGPDGRMHSAPMTFARKSDAERWLALFARKGDPWRVVFPGRAEDHSRRVRPGVGRGASAPATHPRAVRVAAAKSHRPLPGRKDARQADSAGGAELASAAS